MCRCNNREPTDCTAHHLLDRNILSHCWLDRSLIAAVSCTGVCCTWCMCVLSERMCFVMSDYEFCNFVVGVLRSNQFLYSVFVLCSGLSLLAVYRYTAVPEHRLRFFIFSWWKEWTNKEVGEWSTYALYFWSSGYHTGVFYHRTHCSESNSWRAAVKAYLKYDIWCTDCFMSCLSPDLVLRKLLW